MSAPTLPERYHHFRPQQNTTYPNSDKNGIQAFIPISEIRFNEYVYPCKQPLYAVKSTNAEKSRFTFCVDKLYPPIIGIGDTAAEAEKNFYETFHNTFRTLSVQMDWERSKEEQVLWDILEDTVDIQAHRKKTPFRYKQTAKIHDKQGDCVYLQWINDRIDEVSASAYPALNDYTIGQYITVESFKEYETDNLLKILSIEPSTYREMTDAEHEEFINSLPSTRDLPDSTIWN
jgi:hypothetical protein